MPFHDEITDFFGRYVDAFAREDADTLSELWDEVGLFPTPTGGRYIERTQIYAKRRQVCLGVRKHPFVAHLRWR